ncbi:MAG: hypothetical protein R2780_06165 [Crocinitomicaceae bacterium]|nr:hypothetical protein [Crocinitomicaceae bacterium]
MKLFFPALLALVLSLFSACSPSSKYKAEIAQIDSCLTMLDSLEEVFNGIEFDSLTLMVNHVKANEDSIHKYYYPDTLSREIGMRMTECKGIRKQLQNREVQKETFTNEFPATRKQLNNLKSDITNGVLSEEKVKQYVEVEVNAFNDLNLAFTNFYEMQELQKLFYYSAVPVIDALIEQIKNEPKEE